VKIKRELATPITIGAFLISAVTGVLMFFHLDIGLNKVAHEWLSWMLLLGVVLHIVVNFSGFKRYFSRRNELLVIGFFVLLLLLSFFPLAGDSEPPFIPPLKALSKTPLTTLALVAEVAPDQLLERLAEAGIEVKSRQQSVSDLVGDDLREQVQVLSLLLAPRK
jgi:hypothetical protein